MHWIFNSLSSLKASDPRRSAEKMKMRRKHEWFDDNSFWIQLYPFMFPEGRFKNVVDQVEKILNLVKPAGKAVLDLCCGPGRHSIILAKKGFAVTGVDKTEFLLQKAKAEARAAEVKIEWIQQDMRDFVRPEVFDFVLSMFTSFGYFKNKGEDIKVLRNMFWNLKPGGSCLIDVMGKELLAKVFHPTTSERLPDGTMLVQQHEIFDNWSRIRNEWTLIRKGRPRTFEFYHTVYSGQELKDRLEQVGFRNVKLYGDLGGEEYGRSARRLIAVGKKPKTRMKKKDCRQGATPD